MPKAKTKPEAVIPPEVTPDVDAAKLRQQQQIADLTRQQPVTIVLPGGARENGAPYLGERFPLQDQGAIYYDPASIVRPDARRKGWTYCWAKRDNNQTSAWINCGWYEPVRSEEIDRVPGALVQTIEMPAGPSGQTARFVALGSLILCAMPPEVWDRVYGAAERKCKGDQAAMSVSLEARINAQLNGSGVVQASIEYDNNATSVPIASGRSAA